MVTDSICWGSSGVSSICTGMSSTMYIICLPRVVTLTRVEAPYWPMCSSGLTPGPPNFSATSTPLAKPVRALRISVEEYFSSSSPRMTMELPTE